MEASSDVARAQPAWARFTDEVVRPARCRVCGHLRVYWDGFAERTATVHAGDRAIHVTGIRCRRVRCAACCRSWQLRPPGLLPRRHYQLCLVVRPENPILVGSRSLIETRPQPRDAPARRRPAGGGLRRRR